MKKNVNYPFAFFLVLLLLSVNFNAYAAYLPWKTALRIVNDKESKKIDIALENYLLSLGKENAIAQLCLVNIEGSKSYSPVETVFDVTGKRKDKDKPLVSGGFLFFSYNIAPSAKEAIEFSKSITDYCLSRNLSVPYIAVDQEGGEVNRLKHITSYLPSEAKIAKTLTPEESYNLYKSQAMQMKALGFSMNLAPVVESLDESNKEFLGLRSFGSPSKSIIYSSVFVRAFEESSVASVIKHFPGNTNVDPHTGLPFLDMTEAQIIKKCVSPLPFIFLENPSCVLMSHAKTSSFENNVPACLSSFWIQKILKETLLFKGLVISDDIFMKAFLDNGFSKENAAVRAIEAGCDVIMLSEKRCAYLVKILLVQTCALPISF